MDNADQLPRKRRTTKSFAERQQLYAEQAKALQEDKKKDDASSKATHTAKPRPASGQQPQARRRAWEGFRLIEAPVLTRIVEALTGHGWEDKAAVAFAEKAAAARLSHERSLGCAACGERAPVASETHGPLCVECLLDLECGVVLPEAPQGGGFGQRRLGGTPGEPSPAQENAQRLLEGE